MVEHGEEGFEVWEDLFPEREEFFFSVDAVAVAPVDAVVRCGTVLRGKTRPLGSGY
jgi:hypothetical protein